MSDDISAVISADTTEFSDAINQAKSDAGGFFSYLTETGSQAMTSLGAELKVIGGQIYQETKSVLLDVGHQLAVTALNAALFGTAVTAVSSQLIGFGATASIGTTSLSVLWRTMRVGLSVSSWFVPWLKVAALSLTAVSLATHAYRAADEYLNGELTNSIVHVAKTAASWDRLQDAVSETGEMLGMAGDSIGSVGASLVQMAVDASGVSSVMQFMDGVFAGAVDSVTASVKSLNQTVVGVTDAMADWAAGGATTAAQLRDMAKASDELMAKQTAQAVLFGALREAQDNAASTAAHNAELQRIAALDNVGAINLEVNALQQKAAAAILAGTATEDSQKKVAALFLALENQKNAVASGKMQKPHKDTEAESAIAQAEQQLQRLKLGQDEAAIAAIIAAGATQQEVDALRALQSQIANVNAEADARKESERAAAEAESKRNSMRESANSTITRMMDEIDLLTGAATKAEVAMREMARQGFDEDQVAEVGRLSEELERLKDQDQPEKTAKVKSPAADRTALKAAFAGSSEAASIMLRGVGGGRSIEQIANKQLAVQQQTLVAIKDNKPPALLPLTLGT